MSKINSSYLIHFTKFITKKTSGMMSNKGIIKKSTDFGNKIAHKAAETGRVSVYDIQQIISSQLGRKAKNINLVQDKQGFLKAMQEAVGTPAEFGEMLWNNSLSASLPNAKGATILNIRADKIDVDKIANIATHEYEHALRQTFSIRQKLAKLFLKTPMGKRNFEKFKPYVKDMNNAAMYMQKKSISIGNFGSDAAGGLTEYKLTLDGLLKQTKASNIESIRCKYKGFLKVIMRLNKSDKKLSRIKLKGIKHSLYDEAYAYAAGGKAEQTYLSLIGGNPEGLATKSEFNSMLNKEALKIVKKELLNARLNRLKEFFGFKNQK